MRPAIARLTAALIVAGILGLALAFAVIQG
jgi:hypothetical protein